MAINKLKVLPALLLTGVMILSGCTVTVDNDSKPQSEPTTKQAIPKTTKSANPRVTESATLEDLVSAKDLESANEVMDETCAQFTTADGREAYSDCEIYTENNALVKEYTYAIDPTSVTTKEEIKQAFENMQTAISQEVLNDVKNFKNRYPDLKTMQVAYRYIAPDGSLFAEVICEEDGTCVFSE